MTIFKTTNKKISVTHAGEVFNFKSQLPPEHFIFTIVPLQHATTTVIDIESER